MKTSWLALAVALGLSGAVTTLACGDSADSTDSTNNAGGSTSAGAAGATAGSAGTTGGSAGTSSSGAGGAGAGGTAGGSGQSGSSGNSGQGGTAGGSAGASGEAGAGGSPAAGASGSSGQAGGPAGAGGQAGASGSAGAAGATSGATVAWQDKPTEPYQISGQKSLDWGFYYEVLLKGQPEADFQIDLERCQQPAGIPESCSLGGKQAAHEGMGAIKYGIDPSQYNKGENSYRMTLFLYQKGVEVSKDTLVIRVTVTD